MSIRSVTLNRRTFVAVTALLAAGCVRSSPSGRLKLAAGDPGGLYLAFAQILAERVQARYPNLIVDVIPTEGSVQNLTQLRAGEVDMGLALADIAEHDRAAGLKATAPQAVGPSVRKLSLRCLSAKPHAHRIFQISRASASPSARQVRGRRRPVRCCSTRRGYTGG